MEDKDLTYEIAVRLKKKYSKIVEIERLTEELDEALKRNDKQSVNMVLTMRGEEMDSIDIIDAEITVLENGLTKEQRMAVRDFQNDNVTEGDMKELIELKRLINRLLGKIVEKDRTMNIKIAGKSSFYIR
ncbi:MAG: hypothetical protein HFE62_05285 [Firmicutes bacterium]|nr:hypothetical protein [Bacillota bacterium]